MLMATQSIDRSMDLHPAEDRPMMPVKMDPALGSQAERPTWRPDPTDARAYRERPCSNCDLTLGNHVRDGYGVPFCPEWALREKWGV